MALNPKLSDEAANAAADAVCALANSGYLRVYSGAQPETVDTAASTQTLLAELRLAATAFAPASGGVAPANQITSEPACRATDDASWYRVVRSNGTSALWDGSVGTSGCNLNFETIHFVANARIDVSSFSYTEKKDPQQA